MKAIWKGYLRCNLVAVPVNMYNAIVKKGISFHLLHKECKTRIKYEKYCPVHDRVVTNEEIVKGFQLGRDTFVIVTDEDLKKARKEPTEVLDIVKFVDDDQVPPVYISDSHYLAPNGKVGTQSFALFHRAMVEEKKTALAKLVMRNREHLFAIKPQNGTLIAHTLHYSREVIPAEKVEETEKLKDVKIEANNLGLAKTLIQNMSGDFNPEEYKDEYTETLTEVIRAKAAGEEIRIEPHAKKAEVINFMAALKKSVQETQKKAPEVPKKAMATAGKGEREHAARRKKTAHT